MLKNDVDFHCSVNMFRSITMKFIWQQFANLCLLTEKISCILHESIRSYPLLKIPTIADPAHVSYVIYVLRFIQVPKPIISSRIIRFQVEQTNNTIALVVFMFILNISGEQTNTNTLSIDIYDSGQC